MSSITWYSWLFHDSSSIDKLQIWGVYCWQPPTWSWLFKDFKAAVAGQVLADFSSALISLAVTKLSAVGFFWHLHPCFSGVGTHTVADSTRHTSPIVLVSRYFDLFAYSQEGLYKAWKKSEGVVLKSEEKSRQKTTCAFLLLEILYNSGTWKVLGLSLWLLDNIYLIIFQKSQSVRAITWTTPVQSIYSSPHVKSKLLIS